MTDFKKHKQWATQGMTADLVISKVPCLVSHVRLSAGTAGAAATALVYDGVDTSGELKIALSTTKSLDSHDDFKRPMYFEKGIYVDIGSNVTLFSIQFQEERG